MAALAAKSQNPWIVRRFSLVLAILVLGAVALGLLVPNVSNTQLLLSAVLAGASFYIYMLIEINGPIHRAVVAYVAQLPHGAEVGKS